MSLFPKIAHFILFCKEKFVPLQRTKVKADGKKEDSIH